MAEQPDKKKKSDDPSAAEQARSMGIALTIPVMLGSCVLVGTFIGYWLDKHLGTGPWFLLVFLIYIQYMMSKRPNTIKKNVYRVFEECAVH